MDYTSYTSVITVDALILTTCSLERKKTICMTAKPKEGTLHLLSDKIGNLLRKNAQKL
jgi:hypothetical protein